MEEKRQETDTDGTDTYKHIPSKQNNKNYIKRI